MYIAESVTIGHPDKLCDQIADNILTAYLKEDENSRVACEVCAYSTGILVMGEITSKGNVDVEKIVRNTIISIYGIVMVSVRFAYHRLRRQTLHSA